MALDAADARFELAYEHAVAEDGGVIFDHGPAQPGDLLAHLLAHRDKIRSHIGAQRLDLGLQIHSYRLDLRVHPRDIGANISQKFENKAFRLRAQPDLPRYGHRKMR